jgi:copper(I)-binding protein
MILNSPLSEQPSCHAGLTLVKVVSITRTLYCPPPPRRRHRGQILKMYKHWLIRVGVCLWLSAAAAGTPPEGPIQIKDGWVRWLPADLPAGGYLTLVNTGSVAVMLTGATSADYGSVSLHQSRPQGGTTQMVAVNSIRVEPHATLDFASTGYHLMLLAPKRALHPGDHIGVTLTFSAGVPGSAQPVSAQPVSAQLELRSPDAGAPPH